MTFEPASFFDAIKQGDRQAVERMLAEDASLAGAREPGGSSAVLTAIYYQEPEIADLLIDRGAPLDMFEASAAGRVSVVAELHDRDPALVEAWAPDGFQPLGLACFFGHAAMVELLLERGAPVSSPSRNSLAVQPINSAAAGQHVDIVQMLLARGANPSARQGEGFTPLHAAAENGQVEMIQLLLAHGAEPNALSNKNKTPRELAMAAGHTEAAALL